MAAFIDWFNHSKALAGAVRTAITHLYFECIHPSAYGNRRIGRALCEKALL
jgi:Fic family protein